MLSNNNIHAILDKKRYVLFHAPSLTFFKATYDNTKNIENANEQIISNSLINQIATLPDAISEQENINSLNKLVLLIAQDCNLRCKYCFADSGKYELVNGRRMEPDTAFKAIKEFLQTFDGGISLIQFFGGEPLLNFKLIKDVVPKVNQFCAQKNIKKPLFGLVTNGTIFNSEIISFFNENNISATISLDGGKEVNDCHRVYASGKGSFEVIEKNIHFINSSRTFPLFAEITLTKAHLSGKTKAEKLIEDIRKLGFDGFTIGFVANKPAKIGLTNNDIPQLKIFCQKLIDYSLDSMTTDHPFPIFGIIYLIEKIVHRKKVSHPCGAGQKNFTISASGEVLPCYLFSGRKNYVMHSIDDCNQALNTATKFNEIKQKFEEQNKTENSKWCSECWLKTLCMVRCPGFSNTFYDDMAKPDPVYCEYGKILTERVLLKLADLFQDKDSTIQFLKNVDHYHKSLQGIK